MAKEYSTIICDKTSYNNYIRLSAPFFGQLAAAPVAVGFFSSAALSAEGIPPKQIFQSVYNAPFRGLMPFSGRLLFSSVRGPASSLTIDKTNSVILATISGGFAETLTTFILEKREVEQYLNIKNLSAKNAIVAVCIRNSINTYPVVNSVWRVKNDHKMLNTEEQKNNFLANTVTAFYEGFIASTISIPLHSLSTRFIANHPLTEAVKMTKNDFTTKTGFINFGNTALMKGIGVGLVNASVSAIVQLAFRYFPDQQNTLSPPPKTESIPTNSNSDENTQKHAIEEILNTRESKKNIPIKSHEQANKNWAERIHNGVIMDKSFNSPY